MVDKHLLQSEVEKLDKLHSANKSVFWFDIDLVNLGLFNRLYGREKGNDFLKTLEAFLQKLPGESFCCRLESGHFVFDVIKDAHCTEHSIIKYWKAHVREFVHAQQKLYPEFSIRISCGICKMSKNESVYEVIENATFARKESRNNSTYIPVYYKSELLENLSNLHKREVQIHKALIEDRFVYFLQPIVDLKTGRIIAAEALSRGISVDGNISTPDTFLPIMENNGSVVELDFLILRKVCKDLRRRIDANQPVVCTSINLSRLHLEDETTAESIFAISEEYNIKPELLNFELTETLPVNEFSKAKFLIDKLRGYGYSVSIDDYGSGYNGITIWQDLYFDVLKMDRKFLSDDEAIKMRNTVLIPNTIDLAKKMHIDVVCEGVERLDQCEALKGWGCEIAQGFYFSRPISVDAFYKQYEETKGEFPLIAQ